MKLISVNALLVILALPCVQCGGLVDELASFKATLDRAIAEAKDELMQTGHMIDPDQGTNQMPDGGNNDPQSMAYSALDHNYTLQADIALNALKKLIDTGIVSLADLTSNNILQEIWRQRFSGLCPSTSQMAQCDPKSPYRTSSGYCNNLANPSWGAALTPQLRELPPVYGDGISKPSYLGKNGKPLPGTRVISNKMFDCPEKSPRNPKLTVMVMQWGQFIDHDFVQTPVMKETDGGKIPCCEENNRKRRECHPIYVPENDTYFREQDCINMVRSAPSLDIACSPGPREQVNKITSFLDGSAIYGSSLRQTNRLRSMISGLLKTTTGNLLPHDVPSTCTLTDRKESCQMAGDSRVNVVPSLGLSHLTFVREHNRIAEVLHELNPHWSDETIFQEARRIVVAIQQQIHYDEYLPAILNEATMREYKLTLGNSYSNVYKDTVNPGITNVFGVAAFRFGHSQIPSYQATMSTDKKFTQFVNIENTYHNPHMLVYGQGLATGAMAKWLAYDTAPVADIKFENGTRNLLFRNAKNHSLDLAAINVERARDHGIPPYTHWRKLCNLAPTGMARNGEFLLPHHKIDAIEQLMGVYDHVDDIDLFVGAMTETLLPDSSVGPTFACLLGRQFQSLKEGDRFWYESPDERIKFTEEQLKEIKKTRFAKLLCDSYLLDKLQPNVFRVPVQGNMVKSCITLPGIDLTKWKSCSKRNVKRRLEFDLTKCPDLDDDDYSSGSDSCNGCTYSLAKFIILLLIVSCNLHH